MMWVGVVILIKEDRLSISGHREKEIKADVQDYYSKKIYRESFARIMRLPQISR
jgi:HSP20 family molecular chaperone IbpA